MLLLPHVVLRVLAIGHGQATPDKPRVQVLIPKEANRNQPSPTIPLFPFAANVSLPNHFRKCIRGLLPASPLLAGRAGAALTRFGCVDSVKSDLLALDLERVPVDDASAPYQALGAGATARHNEGQDRERRYSSHAQPAGLWHFLSRGIHESPHALVFRQLLQQARGARSIAQMATASSDSRASPGADAKPRSANNSSVRMASL